MKYARIYDISFFAMMDTFGSVLSFYLAMIVGGLIVKVLGRSLAVAPKNKLFPKRP